ncbi:MAG TPA: tRNA (adenosine(37)-N6)-threonylcarbamoyltransferase complex ATPase subunit type 1 TsaE [Candidatus Caccopulliclostridium gallistercoris]|uniref:tRNA threonylcarbamoyladenosine biosynthesis protein TsaE n=1 Tax=Candidatus Caccopulliclostridium gallistercoris TaxID=2840719 RepID=A0A9D1NE51_9FIRM|nr:tRNA (adenosine(37)-N6)-threonylcarbamoyltransferase complex ATPase subunit type 1 TsaE [Candidatus Caccopulliclostridium gallistercoris]
MKLKVKTTSPEETERVAEKLARSLGYPAVISLVGDLGAGKTTFTKGFAKGLDIKENVTSPTFTIMNEYTSGRKPMYHFDMYRLSSLDEALELGFGEYFDLTTLKGASIVEWAENTKGILPARHFEVGIKKLGDNAREISVEPKGLV